MGNRHILSHPSHFKYIARAFVSVMLSIKVGVVAFEANLAAADLKTSSVKRDSIP